MYGRAKRHQEEPTMTPDDARNAQLLFSANREVRTIGRDWLHPNKGNGPRPMRAEEMPSVEGLLPSQTKIMAYETTTEGTPISPAYVNSPLGRLALVRFCAANRTTSGTHMADAEAWAVILFGQGAAVTADGVVIASDR
jgi:hypothetical protein